jgi:hypothetical protein
MVPITVPDSTDPPSFTKILDRMPGGRRSDLVRHIVCIDLDQGLADANWIANALEPPPDRQPRDACNLRHSYFCPHYSLIFPFAFSLPHFDFGGKVEPAQFCGTACNDIE